MLYRSAIKVIILLFLGTVLLFVSGCSHKYKKGTPATMRDYRVRGRHYYPTYVKLGQRMRGVSSWYGRRFHGHRTSNGERYNMYARTAAHKTLPMNTMVKVTNLRNGKSTIVRINDRGPFVRGRIIDCSYRAGREIGLNRTGIAKVELKVVGFAGKIYTPSSIKTLPKSKQKIRLSNFGIQVGAFKNFSGAKIYRHKHAHLSRKHRSVIKHMHNKKGIPIYRVWLMGFESEDEAIHFIHKHRLRDVFIVRE